MTPTKIERKPSRVTVLGINGYIGHAAARAFAEAGWEVTGFGRTNRHPIRGVSFIAGDANRIEDLRSAVRDADVVVNALNLPYDKWDNGRMEALFALVVAAIGPRSGKTMMLPGNIYNFAASQRVVTPDAPQTPETPRGAIRVRSEAMMKGAADRGDFQFIVIRAGDFFGGEDSGDDIFGQGILRESAKGRVAVMGATGVGHSWAYLPDLGKAFEKVAWHRHELAAYENFHFAGYFKTHGEMVAAIQEASPRMLRAVPMPWGLMALMGVFMPIMREIVKMRYLWDNPMELRDARLQGILGPDFGTPFADAIAATVAPFFEEAKLAA